MQNREQVDLVRHHSDNLCSSDPGVAGASREALLQITGFCKQLPLNERGRMLQSIVTSVIHVTKNPVSWEHAEKVLDQIPRESGFHLVAALVGERREFAGRVIAKRPEHSMTRVVRGLSSESSKIRDGCRWLLSRQELGKPAAQTIVYALFDPELREAVTKFLSNPSLSQHVTPHLEQAVSSMKSEWRDAPRACWRKLGSRGRKAESGVCNAPRNRPADPP